MKKKILVLILAILAVTLCLAACDMGPAKDNTTTAASVTSIAVIAGTVPTEVEVGQTPDFSGIKVKVSYDDNTSKEVGYSDVTISALDTSSAGLKTVTVTYGEKDTAFSVNVIEKEAVLESIKIVAGSVASSVKRGKTYDTSSLQVEGVYSNGATRGLPIAEVTVSGIDTSTAGDKTLTVTYQGKTATKTVTVIDITGMSVYTGTVAIKIPVGATLDTSGLEVKVDYADNTTEKITAVDLVIGTIDTSAYGKKPLAISYKGYEIAYQIEVVGPVSITILNSESFVREVMVGAALDTSGLQVSVRYSDDTNDTVEIDELTVGTVDTMTAGVRKLTVQYGELSAEVDITVIGVDSMSIESGSVVSEILKGQTFDVSGLKVNGTYTNGKTFAKAFAELTVEGAVDGNTAGSQTITVKYLDKMVTHTVKVCEITSIVVTGVPLTVPAGEEIDVSNMAVYAVYNDSKPTRVLLESGYTHNADEINTDVEGGEVNLVVTYGELTYTVKISNTSPEFDSITIDSFDATVRIDESYDMDSVKITAHYGNGAQKVIESGFTVSVTDNPDNAGEKILTVTYTEDGVTKTATQTIAVVAIKSIAVIDGTLPTVIGKGQTYDYSRVQVAVTYVDNTTKTVSTGITVLGYAALVPGDDNIDRVVVLYEDVMCTYSCHVKVAVDFTIYAGLEHVKRTGYATSVDNLRLLLVYSNGTEEVVYARHLADVTYTGLAAGETNFSVTYEGITVEATLVKADIYQVHALNGTIPGYVLQGNKLSFEDFKLTVVYRYTYNGEEMEEVYLIGLDDANLSLNCTEDTFDYVTPGDRIIQFTYDTKEPDPENEGQTLKLYASAKVIVKGVTSIEVVPGSILTTVKKGQTVDDSELQVKVNYSDGTYLYVSRSELKSVSSIDTTTVGKKTLTVTYAGYNDTDYTATMVITVVDTADASSGMIFAAILPDDILVRDTYQKNFKAYEKYNLANGERAPYYVGDDNPFVLYLNVAVLNSSGLLEEVDGRSVPTVVKVYENGKQLTGAALDAVVKFDSKNNTYDFTEAAIGHTYRLEISPAETSRLPNLSDLSAVTKSHTVTIVDGYNVYNAYELNLITNLPDGARWFDGEGMTESQIFSQADEVKKFLDEKGILAYRNGLKGVVLHKNLDIQMEDLPSKYFVTYEKDGKTYTALVDALGLFNHYASIGDEFSIYGNCYSIFSYNLPTVAHKGFGNNDDPYSSSALFELEGNNREFSNYATAEMGYYYPTEKITYNIVDLAMRDNDPHSNDQSASERHMRGLAGFQVGESVMNITNVNVDAFMVSLSTEEDGLTLNLDKVKFYNAWQGHLFLWSHNNFQASEGGEKQDPWSSKMFGIKVNITDSLLGKCGGPVILAQNANRELACNKGMSIDVVVDEATDKNLYSYVTGEEAWFVAVNQVALAKKILMANDGIQMLSGLLSKPASFMSTDKIDDVPTVNMKMVVMGEGDLTGGSIAEHRGSYTVAIKTEDTTVYETVMNMKINSDDENKALKDLMGPTHNGSLPIFQSSGGGIAYQDIETGALAPFAGMINSQIPYPDPALFEGDYLTIYMQGIGIMLEYYH